MEEKGFLGHKAFGRTYEYFPLVQKADYTKRSLNKLVSDYFEGSVNRLVSFLVEEEKLNARELNQLLKQLDDLFKVVEEMPRFPGCDDQPKEANNNCADKVFALLSEGVTGSHPFTIHTFLSVFFRRHNCL